MSDVKIEAAKEPATDTELAKEWHYLLPELRDLLKRQKQAGLLYGEDLVLMTTALRLGEISCGRLTLRGQR